MVPTIRVIGSLNVDMTSVTPRFPQPGETLTASSFTTSSGGKGANQAVACARLSRSRPKNSTATAHTDQSAAISDSNGLSPVPVKVEMMGAVGGLDSHFAALLQPTLTESGVDTSHIRIVSDAYTGVAVIIVDESANGENRILLSPGANHAGMAPTPEVLWSVMKVPMPDVLVLQAEIPMDTVIGVIRRVRDWRTGFREDNDRSEQNVEVILNPAPAPPGRIPIDLLKEVNHLIMNETEAQQLAPSWEEISEKWPSGDEEEDEEPRPEEWTAWYFHDLGVKTVVVTLGAAGVYYSVGEHFEPGQLGRTTEGRTPAAKVQQVVDTTAAGDTFVGAYAVEVARWRERESQRAKYAKERGHAMERSKIEDEIFDVDIAIEKATRAASRCVERRGAMASIPWEGEL